MELPSAARTGGVVSLIAGVLMYVSMGALTAVLVAFIHEVAGQPVAPRETFIHFLFWPIALAILFAGALEESR